MDEPSAPPGNSGNAAHTSPRHRRFHIAALWANILTGGAQRNIAHRHAQPGASGELVPVISGVYYADVPTSPDACARLRVFNDSSTGKFLDVNPVVGTVVLFPASNLHEVVPSEKFRSLESHSDADKGSQAGARREARISWSFNILVRELGTDLSTLASMGDVVGMKSLLQAGADVDASGPAGFTSLHHAAEAGHTPIVASLLSHRADIGRKTHEGSGAVHLAVAAGHATILELLLQLQPSESSSADGALRSRPMHLAAAGGHVQMMEALLVAIGQSGDDQSTAVRPRRLDGCEPLHNAIMNGHLAAAEFLVRHGADPDVRDAAQLRPIHEALRGGLLDVAKFLVDAGANVSAPDGEGRPAAYWAARGGHIAILDWLESSPAASLGVESGSCGSGSVGSSGRRGSKAEVMADYLAASMLLQGGGEPQVDPHELMPLHAAALEGHQEATGWLLARGADAKAATPESRAQPIHMAAGQGHVAVVEQLLKAGATPHAVSRGKLAPLHWAALDGHLDVISSLIENRASPKAAASDGGQPLHLVAANGHSAAAEQLLRARASTSAATRKSEQPLHFAAKGQHWQVAEVLLAWGADPEAKNSDGTRAAQGLEDLLLRSAGQLGVQKSESRQEL
mmetsp:Transcript_5533/g.20906  ORF Transcript_5533/g.20906 Transcript_5533/m.20906 type:complete len:627 (-) Transcript_5533:474-2354(-)